MDNFTIRIGIKEDDGFHWFVIVLLYDTSLWSNHLTLFCSYRGVQAHHRQDRAKMNGSTFFVRQVLSRLGCWGNKGCARHEHRDRKMKKTMKAIAILLFSITMAAMSSCSKEEDTNQTYQTKIVGKWEPIRAYGGDLQGSNFDNTFENGESYILIFTSDGVCTFQYPEFTCRFVYSIADNILVVGDGIFKIMELTNEKLVLYDLKSDNMGSSFTVEYRKL